MIDNKQPLVTICVSCYNHETYLDDFFKGIINQTYKNIELIITDDYSTDSSRIIIEKWLSVLRTKLKKVIYIENATNLGITKSYNTMFKLAAGRYIKPFASDDIMPSNSIEILVEFMENNPQASVVVGNVCRIRNDYKYGDRYKEVKLSNTNYLNNIQNLHEVLLKDNIIYVVGAMYKDILFKKCGYYDETMLYEDWDYWLTVTKTEKVLFLDDIVCLYRDSLTSLSGYRTCKDKAEQNKRFCIMYENKKKIFAKHYNEIDNEKKKILIKESLLSCLYVAIEERMTECESMVWYDIKKNGEPLTYKEKFHCNIARHGIILLRIKRSINYFICKYFN